MGREGGEERGVAGHGWTPALSILRVVDVAMKINRILFIHSHSSTPLLPTPMPRRHHHPRWIREDDLTDAHLAFLRDCLPIVVQPEVDVRHGFPLHATVVAFEREDVNHGAQHHRDPSAPPRRRLLVSHIYVGEGSYNRRAPETLNRIGTLLYRTFNFYQFARTADVNDLILTDVVLPTSTSSLGAVADRESHGASTPWRSIQTDDHAGDAQTWSVGDKRPRLLLHYSLMHHYRREIPYAAWQREGHRALLFLNTANHMVGERDLNPRLAKTAWRGGLVLLGARREAELYARRAMRVLPNVLASLCCCFAPWLLGESEWLVHAGERRHVRLGRRRRSMYAPPIQHAEVHDDEHQEDDHDTSDTGSLLHVFDDDELPRVLHVFPDA